MVEWEKNRPKYLFFQMGMGKNAVQLKKFKVICKKKKIYTWTRVITLLTAHTHTSPLYPNFLLNKITMAEKNMTYIFWVQWFAEFIFLLFTITGIERILTSKCMENIKTLAFKVAFIALNVSHRWCWCWCHIEYVSYDVFQQSHTCALQIQNNTRKMEELGI